MLKEAGKLVVLVASSVVVVPYTIAFVANMLYGWPRGNKKLHRAFHPRKVYALNYAVLQEFNKLRFTKLWLQWRSYYGNVFNPSLIKDIPFGTNERSLDIYRPESAGSGPEQQNRLLPVVVFYYGGTWGSGDKSMYCLLCNQLANHLQAIVVCPNYLTYPKGFVDDMIQDVVDSLMWIEHYAAQFGGDKERVMMIGHSAGAHLALMGVLGVTMKRLIHSPHSLMLDEIRTSIGPRPSVPLEVQLRFEDRHFDGSSEDSKNGNSTPPFTLPMTSDLISRDVGEMGSENDQGDNGKSSDNSESFYVVNKVVPDGDNNGENNGDKPLEQSVEMVDIEGEKGDLEKSTEEKQDEEEIDEELENADEESPELIIEDDDELTEFQRDIKNIVSSIKCVIGLAGVYDIADHFEHEIMRGVEDISTMGKAMYGPDNFDRFSPTSIVASLPERTSLPPITLVHGTTDYIVPTSSSDKLGVYLQEMGGGVINQIRIPECDHYSICLDLMAPDRPFHDVLIEIVKREAVAYL